MAPAGLGSEAQGQGRVQGEADRLDLVFSETELKGTDLKHMDPGGAERTEWWVGLSCFPGKTV